MIAAQEAWPNSYTSCHFSRHIFETNKNRDSAEE